MENILTKLISMLVQAGFNWSVEIWFWSSKQTGMGILLNAD